MKSAALLLKNTLLLAASNIFLRFCAVCFQAYLASRIGAEQMGIFGIISSVGMIFATISISGVRFAVTRLTAEEVSRGNEFPRSLMCCAFRYSSFFAIVSGCGLYFLAGIISNHYIGDESAALPLRIMAASMPAIAFGGCAEGYFTAKQKIFRLISVQIISQLMRMAFVSAFFELFLSKGAFPADILAAGSLVGEGIFALGVLILYFFEIHGKKEKLRRRHLSPLVRTAFPLAVSAYMRTGLSSAGQVIIPAGLKKSGMAAGGAFFVYGVITQMAMPVIMFPAAVLGALGEVLIPRLTQAQVQNRRIGISYIVNRAFRIGSVFSFGVMGVMLFFSAELGEAVYHSEQAGHYIKILAPIVPIIYIDSVTDGCLKGLGQQLHSMIYNVVEGIVNVVLLFFLLPKFAITGYIIVVYIKELLNAFLSIRRLTKVTAVEIDALLLPVIVCCMCGAWIMGSIVLPAGAALVQILLYVILYAVLLYILSAATREDIKWIATLFVAKPLQKQKFMIF